MQALSRWLIKKSVAWAVVAIVAVLSVASLFHASKVEQDDDVLAFLPRTNPDVAAFYDINRRFGGLDIAIAGIEAKSVFSKDFLTRLRTATMRLNATEGVSYALTLTNVEDFTADPEKGGIRVDYLVRAIPETEADESALRARVLSRDDVVGQLVDKEGTGVLVYCFAVPGTDMRAMAGRVRAVLQETFPSETKYWGGAPFISTYIYDITQEDLRRLAPWAVIVLVLITLASFRDLIGTGLALLSTALGIVMALGLMGFLGVRSNIVLGSMPVILFALGSAYAVHFLSRYYTLARQHGPAGAVQRTLAGLGPTIVATGLTTVAGLLSFIVMDIVPMRVFGLFTAIGLLATLALALTFVPAVIVLAGLKGRAAPSGVPVTSRFMVGLTTFAQRRRVPMGIALGVLFAASVPLALRVDSRMDNAAFFSKGSPPDQAETFMGTRFGGSQFVQVEVAGDMADPLVLREVALVADRIAVLPEVTSVTHIADILALMNEAMAGDRTPPDTAAKAKLLYGFLEGKRAVRQLVTDDRGFALLQVKLKSSRPEDAERALAKVRAIVKEHAGERFAVSAGAGGGKDAEVTARVRAAVSARAQAVFSKYGAPLPEDKLAAVEKALAERKLPVPADAVEKALAAFLGSDEFVGDMPSEPSDARARVAAAAAKLGPGATADALAAAFSEALDPKPSDDAARDLASTVHKPLAEIWRREQTAAWARAIVADLGLPLPEGGARDRLLGALGSGLLDLDRRSALLPAAGAGAEPVTLAMQVTGLPVLHEGLSQSVRSNQAASLVFALGLVLVITSVLYRSLWSGLLASAPTTFTIGTLYAAMTLSSIRLDIGTSVLASLIIGAGVDYAIHFLSAWRAPAGRPLQEAAENAAGSVGQGVWTNALMVAAGFFVLTLGEARPLQNVGSLTAAAMMLSAFATFLLLPTFARKHAYSRAERMRAAPAPSDAPDAVPAEGAPALSGLMNDRRSAPTGGGAPPSSED